MKTNLIILLIIMLPVCAFSQSTSPNPLPALSAPLMLKSTSNASNVITFSEFPIGTSINNQYQDIGIIFGGSSPFISSDGANPTSPVLSGTPRFQGEIMGRFVEPGTDRPTVVQSFSFDAGYFDEFGSTRIEWFDPDGKKLGQLINSHLGIERFTITGGNIASWKIGIVQNEPAGYAIDNVSFEPTSSSVLFREKSDETKDGTWGLQKDEIPGFDHSAFQIGNVVYESHPGYPSGTYVSADGQETVNITTKNGVQSQFTLNTFKHDSKTSGSTNVVDFEEIPVTEELAIKMRSAIQSVQGRPFQFINYSLDGLAATLSPEAQKGGNGAFTCVGLIEWSAEQAGHNNNQGFIKNIFESMIVPDPRTLSIPPKVIEIPLLSPQLLNYTMKSQQILNDATQWIQGLLDPVDFIVMDPLGRRLGFVQSNGVLNEIPNAFYSGNGGVEQFLITNPIPGTYTIELVGIGSDAFMGIGSSGSSVSFKGLLSNGESKVQSIFIEPKSGSGGDVDYDGDVDKDDIQALKSKLNLFTDGLGHPGDLNGDGLLSDDDVELLTQLVSILEVIQINIDILPGSNVNPINLKSNGVIPVAILGSNIFDVKTIKLETLRFGPKEALPAHKLYCGHFEDVNSDGIIDLVSHYLLKETGITAGLNEACINGMTINGQTVKGCDRIQLTQLKSAEVGQKVKLDIDTPELKVYPNPFNNKLCLEFVSPSDANAILDIFDATGRKVKTIFEGHVEGGVLNNAEFIPTTSVNSIYFYRMTLGEEVFTGKMIYNK